MNPGGARLGIDTPRQSRHRPSTHRFTRSLASSERPGTGALRTRSARERQRVLVRRRPGTPTVPRVIDHVRLIEQVDLAYPIILGIDGRVMDGMRRIARAMLESRQTIHPVQFCEHPEPDCRAGDPRDCRTTERLTPRRRAHPAVRRDAGRTRSEHEVSACDPDPWWTSCHRARRDGRTIVAWPARLLVRPRTPMQ